MSDDGCGEKSKWVAIIAAELITLSFFIGVFILLGRYCTDAK
jgi:hypothetical protein